MSDLEAMRAEAISRLTAAKTAEGSELQLQLEAIEAYAIAHAPCWSAVFKEMLRLNVTEAEWDIVLDDRRMFSKPVLRWRPQTAIYKKPIEIDPKSFPLDQIFVAKVSRYDTRWRTESKGGDDTWNLPTGRYSRSVTDKLGRPFSVSLNQCSAHAKISVAP